MTHLGDHKLQPQKPHRGMPHWLVVAITALASSVPVAGVSLMAWPFVLQQTNVVLDRVALACLAGVTLLIGWVLASYALRDRGVRL
ncbi:hypothetical protein ACRAWG_21750 [Methylobacterium sp. P31]